MEFTFSNPVVFPDGTQLGVYTADHVPDQTKPPVGGPLTEATVEDDKAVFAGLNPYTTYFAGADLGSEEAPDWRYVRFSVDSPVILSSYKSVNADVVSATDPGVWTTLDVIEGIVVPDSGRLEVSYAAEVQIEDFVEQEGETNLGDIALFLDDDPIQEAHNSGDILGANFIGFNTEGFEALRSTRPGAGVGFVNGGALSGAFFGAFSWPLAADPGPHSVSFRAKPGEPEGGKLSVRNRRLIAITGSA